MLQISEKARHKHESADQKNTFFFSPGSFHQDDAVLSECQPRLSALFVFDEKNMTYSDKH